MAPTRATPARKYLTGEQRRGQLVEAAAELVSEGGWEALGMAPLAEAAGVSRQLVYEHFRNLDRLHLEVTRHFFDGVFGAVEDALERHPEDPVAAMRTGVRGMLELPRGARLVLRELIAVPAKPGNAMERLRARVRADVTDLWTGPIQRQTGIEEQPARALAWMLNLASWALFDLVEDGTFTLDEAVEFFLRSASGALQAQQV